MIITCRKCRSPLGDGTLQEHAQCTVVTSENAVEGTEMEEGKEGRVYCKKCRSTVGRFKWYGSKCVCGVWMIPYIGIHKRSVDVIKSREG
ncbi:hypothetical protein NECID01_0349 [Nematocida sp. AWRm77]|nr:hypothetical protein NECID01_0349 [Nematocida sp. AWRm77]